MNKIMFKAWVKAQMLKQSAKDYFTSEEGGADSIIIAVIIILVVVVLGFVFKDYIINWFSKLVGQADSQVAANGDPNNWPVPKPSPT